MTSRLYAICVLALSGFAIAACGAEPAEEPREQIIVAEPGEAAAPVANSDEAQETAPDSD